MAKKGASALLVALIVVSGHAQETRGRVQGVVADSTGAIVPGVSALRCAGSSDRLWMREESG